MDSAEIVQRRVYAFVFPFDPVKVLDYERDTTNLSRPATESAGTSIALSPVRRAECRAGKFGM